MSTLCQAAVLEHRVVERPGVVVEPDEVRERLEAVPVEQAVTSRLGDGQQHEQPVDERARAAGTARCVSHRRRRGSGRAGRRPWRSSRSRRVTSGPARTPTRSRSTRMSQLRPLRGGCRRDGLRDLLRRQGAGDEAADGLVDRGPERRAGHLVEVPLRERGVRREPRRIDCRFGSVTSASEPFERRQDAVAACDPLGDDVGVGRQPLERTRPPPAARRGRRRSCRRRRRRPSAGRRRPRPPGTGTSRARRRCLPRTRCWTPGRRPPTGPGASWPPCRCRTRPPGRRAWRRGSRPGRAPASTRRWSSWPASHEALAAPVAGRDGVVHALLAADAGGEVGPPEHRGPRVRGLGREADRARCRRP